MWDLSSLIRDWTHAPLLEAWNLNHCTAREVPACPILISERDSLHCCPQSSHTNFVLSLKVIKLMPASGSLSCCFSVWNAHHLDFIELSGFIYPLLTCHLLESLPWPPGFTSLFYHRFLQQVSLPTILFTYLFFVSVAEICTPWGKWEMLFWIPVPGKWHKVGAW